MIRIMDRASLEQMLEQRLSLAKIGRKVGRHEATVSYWLKKYGLEPAHGAKFSSRGGLDRQRLEVFVGESMSIAQIAESTSVSKATVRHWLTRYALKTRGASGRRPRVEAARPQVSAS
jgi:IS30 family transposase